MNEYENEQGIQCTQLQRFDVLLGRGTGPNEHLGNRMYRYQIRQLKDAYFQAGGRPAKDQIVLRAI